MFTAALDLPSTRSLAFPFVERFIFRISVDGKGPKISISDSGSLGGAPQSRFSSAASTLEVPLDVCRFVGLAEEIILFPDLLGEEEMYLETRNTGSFSAWAMRTTMPQFQVLKGIELLLN